MMKINMGMTGINFHKRLFAFSKVGFCLGGSPQASPFSQKPWNVSGFSLLLEYKLTEMALQEINVWNRVFSLLKIP